MSEYSIIDTKSGESKSGTLEFGSWPDHHQALPNFLARTSLISPSRILEVFEEGMTEIYESESLVVSRGPGKALSMFDGSVFMSIADIHKKRIADLGYEVDESFEFISTYYEIAKNICGTNSRRSTDTYDLIEEALRRLRGTTIEIKVRVDKKNGLIYEYKHVGSLIVEFEELRGDGERSVLIRFGKIQRFFNQVVGVTWYPRDELAMLSKKAVAKKVFFYLMSHQKVNSMMLETWRAIVGSKSSSKEFKRIFTDALSVMKEMKVITSFSFQKSLEHPDKEKVVIFKPLTRVQRRLELNLERET
jgi:hypothetical protein